MDGKSGISSYGEPFARDQSAKAIRAAYRRKWMLIGALGLIVASAIAAVVVHQNNKASERVFTQQYLKAQELFNQEIEEFREKLSKSENLQNVDSLEPDHTGSTPLFREFAQAHPDHPLGWQAALQVAQQSMASGSFQEAVDLLAPMVPKTRRFPIMQVKLRETLAGLYAELGDYEKALAELDIVEKIPENPLPAATALRRAQFLFLSGDKTGAQGLLEQLASGRLGEISVSTEISSDARSWLAFWGLKKSSDGEG